MAKRRPAEARLAQAWKEVWDSPQGRLALSELMISTNVYSEIVTSDPVQLALAVGERNVGARIARHIGLKPEAYVQHAQDAADLVGRFIESETDY